MTKALEPGNKSLRLLHESCCQAVILGPRGLARLRALAVNSGVVVVLFIDRVETAHNFLEPGATKHVFAAPSIEQQICVRCDHALRVLDRRRERV